MAEETRMMSVSRKMSNINKTAVDRYCSATSESTDINNTSLPASQKKDAASDKRKQDKSGMLPLSCRAKNYVILKP
jgi:hypothetical protein